MSNQQELLALSLICPSKAEEYLAAWQADAIAVKENDIFPFSGRPAKHEQTPSSVSSPEGPTPPQNPTYSSRHGRSLSHPLASLLGQGTNFDNRYRNGSTSINTGAQNDDSVHYPQADTNGGGQPDIPRNASTPVFQGVELTSGKCATCSSSIKWPKRLTIFRCTICLMVNDLRPLEKRRPDGLHPLQSGSRTLSIPATIESLHLAVVDGISLSTTNQILSHCLRTYMHSFILSEEDNGITQLENGNAGPCAHETRAAHTDKVIIDPGDCGTGSLQFDDMCDTFDRGYGRIYVYEHAPCLQSSWPTRTSQAQTGKGVSTHVMSPPAGHALAVAEESIKQKLGHSPRTGQDHVKINSDNIFRPMENYIVQSFHDCDLLNQSFCLSKPPPPLRTVSEGTITLSDQKSQASDLYKRKEAIFEIDGKTLLLGDVAENGAWWLGKHGTDPTKSTNVVDAAINMKESGSNAKPPRTDWIQLQEWYNAILNAGQNYSTYIQDYCNNSGVEKLWTAEDLTKIQSDINKSCTHLRRNLLKATESLLRRPGRPLRTPGDCRFLLLCLANPLLYLARTHHDNDLEGYSGWDIHGKHIESRGTIHKAQPSPVGRSNTRSHTGIVKRILGLMANLSPESHRQLISWLARYPDEDFRKLVDLVGGFVTHRLIRQRRKLRNSNSKDPAAVLVPEISRPGSGSPSQLHAALRAEPSSTRPEKFDGKVVYSDDWQVKAAAKVMSLLFLANSSSSTRRQGPTTTSAVPETEQSTPRPERVVGHVRPLGFSAMSRASLKRARKHGQLLPTSAFYNSLLDYCDLVADFEAWENRRASFSFCQYPMFLSLWAKIRILEHDARRQMETRARQAFFNSIMRRSAVSQYLLLKVRRECLVDDSLRAVSEIVGSGQEEIKKSLRIAFQGEEGVDAGGLRKEWFLLLVREVFDPEHGMFVYDEDSRYCYFNPHTYETSDQYFLVGVVLGLAIYNSTILDVALPPFAFRKLLASAPKYTGPSISLSRPSATHTLSDLAEFRPALASGLQKLLDYDGDVEDTFCRDFIIENDRYGQPVQVPLCPDGEGRAVTNNNRGEFVELYVRYLLDTSVSRQFEPFKRGFFSVCGGNALSLFRPEEIELLIRGSDEGLDVATLQAVAIYDGWKETDRPEDGAVIAWFWEIFAEATVREQRALLSFITGSDRLPAMGATSLIIKHETGMSRLALSDADKMARDWFVHETKSLGCDVTVDKMGNIFAFRRGRKQGFPPTCAGSHLDTQPTGGRYDGILGVCAGLEMLKVLHEQKIETYFPVGVINWTNEEGARFPISMVGSGVWAGEIPLEKAHDLKEVGGDRRTLKEELERIGYLGKNEAAYQAIPLGGPRLQAGKKRIGIVHGVQAYRWHTITVKGQDCNRSDALLTAAKLILHSHRMAVKYDALASTGIIRASPGSTNTVPGRVQFSLDIRAAKDEVLMDLEKHLKSDFDEINHGNPLNGLNNGLEVIGRPCTINWALESPSRATKFDSNCIDCVRQSAEDLLGPPCSDSVQEMNSGAGMVTP
ncbi:MAG: hypothetical protein Q9205_002538 [Flavoplaca limonia]